MTKTTYQTVKRGLSPRTPGWSGTTNEDRNEKSGCFTPLRVHLQALPTATKNMSRSEKYSSPHAHVLDQWRHWAMTKAAYRLLPIYNPLLNRIFSEWCGYRASLRGCELVCVGCVLSGTDLTAAFL